MNKNPWEPYDTEFYERETKCIARGEDNGRRELPETSELSLSEAEQDIIDKIQSSINKDITRNESSLKNKEDRINELEENIVRDRFADIKTDLSTKLGIIFNNLENRLQNAYEEWLLHRREYNTFKTDNRLDRPYNHKSNIRKFVSLILVLTIMAVEVYANSKFLTSAMVGGASAAMTLSMSIAFINVFVSFLIGSSVARQLNHFKFSRKVTFAILLGLYCIFAIWLNFSVGTYRAMAESYIMETNLSGNIMDPALVISFGSMAMQPWNSISDLDPTAWTLVVMGITFAAIGIADGYQFDDVYPGYGKVGKKMTQDKNDYLDIERKAVVDANKEYDIVIKTAKDYEAADNNDRSTWSNLINECEDIYKGYSKWIKNIQIQILQHCIGHYRKSNKKWRKTGIPSYFSEEIKFNDDLLDVKTQFSSTYDNCFYSDHDRKEKVNGWDQLNKSQYNSCLGEVQVVKKEFDDKVRAKKKEFSIYV